MGIRKEIKAVLRDRRNGVIDTVSTLHAIDLLVNARIEGTKPKAAPHLIVTDGKVQAKGVIREDAVKMLKTALALVTLDVAVRKCEGCQGGK